jgi:type IV secretory pathway VirB2 component (pilin)
MAQTKSKTSVLNTSNIFRSLIPLLITAPAFGAGLTTFTNMVTKFTTFITGGFGVTILTLVIMGAGLMAFFNKLDVSWVARIVIGSVLIFGAASIANVLLS